MAPAPTAGAPHPVVPPIAPTPRLRGPDDPARDRRLAWAVLMKRTWGLDVLACPRCAGPMRLVAAIEDADVAARILRHLNLPTRAPPRPPPWRPQRELALEPGPDAWDEIDAPAFAE